MEQSLSNVEKKSLLFLGSRGCHPKNGYLSFIGSGEPLKSTDQQRNGHDSCALTDRMRKANQGKGKSENYLRSWCNSLQQ